MWSGHSHMYSWAGKLGRHGGFGPEKGWRLHHSTVAQLLTHQVKTSALTCSLEVKAVLLTHLSHKCTEVHVWASQAASWPDGDVLPSLLNPQNTLWQSCLFISALWWAELRGPLLVSCGIRIEIGFFLRKLVSFFFLFLFSPFFFFSLFFSCHRRLNHLGRNEAEICCHLLLTWKSFSVPGTETALCQGRGYTS